MDNKLTGEFISKKRREIGLSQKQLAERLNVTDKAVSKWETGRSAPDISMLMPLSEVLNVTVIEILKGKEIEKEKLSFASDEAVVSSMKNGKIKTLIAVTVSVAVMLIMLCLSVASYVGYHYFSSIPVKDSEIIENVSDNSFFADFVGNPEIVKRDKKGDYYFYLLGYDNGAALSVFRRDKIFKDRISFFGGTSVKQKNTVELYCSSDNNLAVNVFVGYGMTVEAYSYIYRGVECKRTI